MEAFSYLKKALRKPMIGEMEFLIPKKPELIEDLLIPKRDVQRLYAIYSLGFLAAK